MPGTFQLEIVTPERSVFRDEVISLVAPGVEGQFGILVHHAPFIAALRPGAIKIRDRNNREILLATSGGFFEIARNQAVLLADTAEFAAEIDVARAQAALERARERLRGGRITEVDRERAERALERAAARIRVAAQSRLE
jgi:F-type H+-transporting ATPase subunit epsilon